MFRCLALSFPLSLSLFTLSSDNQGVEILMGRNARTGERVRSSAAEGAVERVALVMRRPPGGYGAYRGNNGLFAPHVTGVNEEQ